MKIGILLLGAVAMTGCGVSLQPFFSTANLYDDPSVEGRWSDGESAWVVTRTSPAHYTIAFCEGKDQCQADTVATLFRIDGVVFLDFQEKPSLLSDALRPHGLFQLRVAGDVMEISLLDADLLTARAAENRLPVDHLSIENRLFLTAPPAQLQLYLAQHLSDPQVFGEPHQMMRQ